MTGDHIRIERMTSSNFVNGDVSGNVISTSNLSKSVEKASISEFTVEIKRLLKQLETQKPNATQSDKINYINDETTPSFKRRAVAALQAGGETAIEEFLDNPYLNVGKAIVKSWLKPE